MTYRSPISGLTKAELDAEVAAAADRPPRVAATLALDPRPVAGPVLPAAARPRFTSSTRRTPAPLALVEHRPAWRGTIAPRPGEPLAGHDGTDRTDDDPTGDAALSGLTPYNPSRLAPGAWTSLALALRTDEHRNRHADDSTRSPLDLRRYWQTAQPAQVHRPPFGPPLAEREPTIGVRRTEQVTVKRPDPDDPTRTVPVTIDRPLPDIVAGRYTATEALPAWPGGPTEPEQRCIPVQVDGPGCGDLITPAATLAHRARNGYGSVVKVAVGPPLEAVGRWTTRYRTRPQAGSTRVTLPACLVPSPFGPGDEVRPDPTRLAVAHTLAWMARRPVADALAGPTVTVGPLVTDRSGAWKVPAERKRTSAARSARNAVEHQQPDEQEIRDRFSATTRQGRLARSLVAQIARARRAGDDATANDLREQLLALAN